MSLAINFSTNRISQYISLTKPRVNLLIVFCALIGMLMALLDTPNVDSYSPVKLFLALVGIGLVSSAAAAVNCLVEQQIDRKMARTAWRPLPSGTLTKKQTIIFSLFLSILGFWLLVEFVNNYTAFLTLATFAGYAFIYTILLKPLTPQNIVIGGASGAMPPVLGWAAVNGTTPPEAWILFLIIFVWTPPHFWALALYRVDDYKRSGLPMLPVTHGSKFTRLQILLYTVLLVATSTLPFLVGMSGLFYLLFSTIFGLIFLLSAWRLYREYSEKQSKQVFKYSINYLILIFFTLILDKLIIVFV